MKKKKIIKWTCVLVWMLIIFLFSSQTGEESSGNNRFIEELLLYFNLDVNVIFHGMGSYIIRKTAHFSEYFILYYLTHNAVKEDFSYKNSLFISLIIVFLYACTDELHQYFIPGRGPAFKDVLIDTGGGGLAFILKSMVYCFRKNDITSLY